MRGFVIVVAVLGGLACLLSPVRSVALTPTATPTPNLAQAQATIAALKTQVAVLETTVADLGNGTANTGATPTAENATKAGHVLTGTITIYGDVNSVVNLGDHCSGTGGFSDMAPGSGVTVKDESGTIIATGQLDFGVPDKTFRPYTCTFSFTVEGIPDRPFYTVSVGHRGDLSYAAEDLDAADWTVDLSLGSP